MAFVKDDSRAVALFDAALQTATDTPSLFLFVSLIPGNLPSGHLERFKGNLFRKLGQGLLRCREAGLQWSVRALQCPDIDKTASAFVKQYAPDTLFLGSPEKPGRTGHDFGNKLSTIHDRIRHCA